MRLNTELIHQAQQVSGETGAFGNYINKHKAKADSLRVGSISKTPA
jgi:hypothetical protein